jgi:periplasmic protein TonB
MVRLIILSTIGIWLICCKAQQPNNVFSGKIEMGHIVPDKPAVFDGNVDEYIKSHIKYPISAIKDSIQGKVLVKCTIDTSGYVKNCILIKCIRKDLDVEALRIIESLHFVKPTMLRGIKINYTYYFTVDFVLP